MGQILTNELLIKTTTTLFKAVWHRNITKNKPRENDRSEVRQRERECERETQTGPGCLSNRALENTKNLKTKNEELKYLE